MKIRADFVTNSSSSSFLLARKEAGEISQEGKDKIADILINRFLGNNLEEIDDVTVENISEHDRFDFRDESIIDASKAALRDGFELVEGDAQTDITVYIVESLLADMMRVLADEENYLIIDSGNLNYSNCLYKTTKYLY